MGTHAGVTTEKQQGINSKGVMAIENDDFSQEKFVQQLDVLLDRMNVIGKGLHSEIAQIDSLQNGIANLLQMLSANNELSNFKPATAAILELKKQVNRLKTSPNPNSSREVVRVADQIIHRVADSLVQRLSYHSKTETMEMVAALRRQIVETSE